MIQRTSHLDDSKPFDALECYLCDAADLDHQRWRTVSLVMAIQGILERGPHFQDGTPETRRLVVRAVARELSARGLDALSLARYGMGAAVVGIIAATLMIEAASQEKMESVHGIDIAGWHAALGLTSLHDGLAERSDSDFASYVENHIFPAIPRLYGWIKTASLDDLVTLAPPVNGGLLLASREPSDRELVEQYTWAVNHFASTFYSDWRTESLHLELRWLDGEIVPPCPEGLMLDRRVSRNEVVAEIAKRVVYGKQEIGSSEHSLVQEMSRHAVSLLKQGKCREAAAVFEFGTLRRPEDAALRNNLGFCLIPEDPQEALKHLQAAGDMGYHSPITNAYNQMCCYVAIRRPRAALNIAESIWNHPSDSQAQNAHLWRCDPQGKWELFECTSVRDCLTDFAASIASNEGWSEEEMIWRNRAKG